MYAGSFSGFGMLLHEKYMEEGRRKGKGLKGSPVQIRHDLVTVSEKCAAMDSKKSTSLLFSDLPLGSPGKEAAHDGLDCILFRK